MAEVGVSSFSSWTWLLYLLLLALAGLLDLLLQRWIRSHVIEVGVEMAVRISSDDDERTLAERLTRHAEEQVQVSAEVPSGLLPKNQAFLAAAIMPNKNDSAPHRNEDYYLEDIIFQVSDCQIDSSQLNSLYHTRSKINYSKYIDIYLSNYQWYSAICSCVQN